MPFTKVANFAKEAHAGMIYSTGHGYYDYHIMNVVNRVKADPKATSFHVMLAYLHDTYEDCPDVTLPEIEELFGVRMCKAVAAISRTPGEVYADYLLRVIEDPLAKLVKLHDLRENLSNAKTLPRGTLAGRYTKALMLIENT